MMTNTQTKQFAERLDALDAFVEREGHALVPSNHEEAVNGTIVNLGSWVSYMRTRYRRGALDEATIREMESYPGWQWGPLRPGPKPDTARDDKIRQMRNENKSLQEIGLEFGLSRQRIHQIVSNNG